MKIKENYTLRKPTGDNLVGVTNLYYTIEEEQAKILPCLCFYPADNKGSNKIKDYVNENILPNANTIKTNSYIDAPVLPEKFPLIIFNHGYSLFNEVNTVQLEELASHGYIVLSVGHPRGGSYVYEDGLVTLFDVITLPKVVMEESALGAQLFDEYALWLNNEGKSASMNDHKLFHEKIIKQQSVFALDSDVWIQDNYFALTKLLEETKLNLANYIDENNIGVLGMAFGGSVALEMSQSFEFIKAAANMDGFYYGNNSTNPLRKPVLLMQNNAAKILTYPFKNAKKDSYLVSFKNSTHANFADYNEFMAENLIQRALINGKIVEQGLLGSIDPYKMEDLINKVIIDFFNKYLKNQSSNLLDKENDILELEIERK